MYNDGGVQSEERGGVDRKQSKIDDALEHFSERLASLGQIISILENRLGSVTNNKPRPDESVVMKPSEEKPTGDSSLLVEMYTFGLDLRRNEDRIRNLLERLDI